MQQARVAIRVGRVEEIGQRGACLGGDVDVGGKQSRLAAHLCLASAVGGGVERHVVLAGTVVEQHIIHIEVKLIAQVFQMFVVQGSGGNARAFARLVGNLEIGELKNTRANVDTAIGERVVYARHVEMCA